MPSQNLTLRCTKTGAVFPFTINHYNNPEVNTPEYCNLILEWWHTVPGYNSLMPFQKLHVTYGSKDTPLIINQSISALLSLPNLLIKDESHAPFWTHKDRRSEVIVNVAIEQWVDKMVCLTAGNSWYSLSRYCNRAGIDYTSILFPRVSRARRQKLMEYWRVMMIDGHTKAGILRYRWFCDIVREFDEYERWVHRSRIRSVTHGFNPVSICAYKEIMYEIAHEKPDYVVMPCGSWELVLGIWLWIKELNIKTKVIAVWAKGEHPLGNALKLDKEEYKIYAYLEKSIADKVTTSYTPLLPLLKNCFSEKWNRYTEVSNEDIMKTKKALTDCNLKAENSALLPFSAFLSYARPDIDSSAKIIIINTGKWIEC